MILTEEEAKTKRCQESFGDHNLTPGGGVVAAAWPGMVPVGGSYALATSPSMCIGSACMAWRWQDSASVAEGKPHGAYGYCGKAGRP